MGTVFTCLFNVSLQNVNMSIKEPFLWRQFQNSRGRAISEASGLDLLQIMSGLSKQHSMGWKGDIKMFVIINIQLISVQKLINESYRSSTKLNYHFLHFILLRHLKTLRNSIISMLKRVLL